MKAAELLKTVAKDLKQSVIQLIETVIEAAKNVGPDTYEKIINSAKQIVKKIADEIFKKSEKKQMNNIPRLLYGLLLFSKWHRY